VEDRRSPKVVPFGQPSTAAAAPELDDNAVVEIHADDGIVIGVRNTEKIDWDEFRRALEQAKSEAARVGSLKLEPDDDIKAIVATLMEALVAVRDRFNLYDRSGRLKDRYEAFRCQLEEAGFAVRFETRAARAAAHRRLGELAEARADLRGALMHYELAVRSRKDVGCRRRADWIRKELEQMAHEWVSKLVDEKVKARGEAAARAEEQARTRAGAVQVYDKLFLALARALGAAIGVYNDRFNHEDHKIQVKFGDRHGESRTWRATAKGINGSGSLTLMANLVSGEVEVLLQAIDARGRKTDEKQSLAMHPAGPDQLHIAIKGQTYGTPDEISEHLLRPFFDVLWD
jgi:hypothetical protein